MPKALTHEQFLYDLSVKQPEIFNKFTVLGKYVNRHTRLLIKCNDCGAETNSTPNKLFAGKSCLSCRKLNNDKYFTRLFAVKPEYKTKYDYTGCVITNSNSRISFKCNDCGYICNTQTANTHFYGNGCPSCNNRPSFSKELLIKRSIEKFGNIFDFTSTEDFSKVSDIITICCPRHGIISTTPQSHLRTKSGCPKCHRYDSDEVMEKFYSNPNNSHIKFVDVDKDLEGEVKVRFIRMHCPKHGEYSTRLNGILRGNGCLMCYHERSEGLYNTTLAERHKDDYLTRDISLYVLYIPSLEVYKIGLTGNIKHRISTISSAVGGEVNILYSGITNLYDAILLEKELLSGLSEFKGSSPIKFGGHTELLKLPDDIASDLIVYLSTVTEEYNDQY